MSETLALLWSTSRISIVAHNYSTYRVFGDILCMSEGSAIALLFKMRDDYEAERRRLHVDHAALVARVKELEAQLANTQQWAGDAVACIRHGMELMPLDQFRHWTGVAAIEQVYSQMMEDANHE